MTSPAVEQNGHAPDGEWYPPLEPVAAFNPELVSEGGNNQNSNDQRDMYRFIYEQSEWQRKNPLGVLSRGHITNPHELRLLDMYQSMFLFEWNAECCNRQGLREQAEKQANYWKGKFGDEPAHDPGESTLEHMLEQWNGEAQVKYREDDDRDHDIASEGELRRLWERGATIVVRTEGDTATHRKQFTVEDLLDQWHSAAAFMARVAIDLDLYGLRSVERHRKAFETARESKQRAEFLASSLPPARNEYFWAMVRSYQLMLDEKEDVALGRPLRDYTELKAKIAKGTEIDTLLGEMPWALQELHARVYLSVADGDIMRRYFLILFTGNYPYEERPMKQRKGLARFFGPRDGDEEEYEEEEDNNSRNNTPQSRFFNRNKDQNRKNGGKRR